MSKTLKMLQERSEDLVAVTNHKTPLFNLYRLNSLTTPSSPIYKNTCLYQINSIFGLDTSRVLKNKFEGPGGNGGVRWRSLFSNLVGRTV